jgi:hypothetical protein
MRTLPQTAPAFLAANPVSIPTLRPAGNGEFCPKTPASQPKSTPFALKTPLQGQHFYPVNVPQILQINALMQEKGCQPTAARIQISAT